MAAITRLVGVADVGAMVQRREIGLDVRLLLCCMQFFCSMFEVGFGVDSEMRRMRD